MNLAELLQLASTCAMVGVIWLVQLVQYPAFRDVPADGFVPFHRNHCRRITWVVGPLMTVELATALWLTIAGASFPRETQWIVLALTVATWATTGLVQVPLHDALGRGQDKQVVDRLVVTNWLRTGLWTAKGVLLGWVYV